MSDPVGSGPDPFLPCGAFTEEERTPGGRVETVATLLLTNRRCPFRCLMCDLSTHTTEYTVPEGAIPAQIRSGLSSLAGADGPPAVKHLKLYNSGSFFDPGAIPPADYGEIAALARGFDTLLVESHPAFVGDRTLRFLDLLQSPILPLVSCAGPARPQVAHGDPDLVEGKTRLQGVPGEPDSVGGNTHLQVAMGLETVHPEVLPRLNKRMTPGDFQKAARLLRSNDISVRAFILLRPPFMTEEEGVEWACRTIDFAFEAGASVCSVIPVRQGNRELSRLEGEGVFSQPSIRSLERVLEYGIGLGAGLVFADLWDLDRFSQCDHCFGKRHERLRRMNLTQDLFAEAVCSCDRPS